MSKKQRRDHAPSPLALSRLCWVCGDPCEFVTIVEHDESRPVSERRVTRGYMRHKRRWHKKPT